MADGSVRAAEIATEQRHVDRVYRRLEALRAETAAATRDGFKLASGGNFAALVDRDAMVYQLSRRLRALDAEYDGLVFGRLDLVADPKPDTDPDATGGAAPADERAPSDDTRRRDVGVGGGDGLKPADDRAPEGGESLHIGRLGLRDERYRPLVVDWRAPAAAAFYRATPTDRMGVVRRRVIRCTGQRVVDVQDDLLDPGSAPDGMAVIGEGALLASLARATGHQMRDIVATIAREQDDAVRAPAFGAALITGGPGTGKTAVALHRAAYLLYSDRNRFESGGVLIVGPSPVFMRYIERVLPSLGEDAVTLRSLGEVLDETSASRLDEPAVAALKGSMRMRQLLRRASRDTPPDAPRRLRLVYAGLVLTLDEPALAKARQAAHRRGAAPNQARRFARAELLAALWAEATRVGGSDYHFDHDGFVDEVADRGEFQRFLAEWWPMLTPTEVLGWLADPQRLRRYAGRTLSGDEVRSLADSMGTELSVADVPLVDELRVLLGAPPAAPPPRVDEDELAEVTSYADRMMPSRQRPERPDHYDEYAHIVLDEAQDLSPMQWRMLGRRGRYASWTIVGDPAQSAWPDPAEASAARDDALRGKHRYDFELTTNYRNSAEIFELAASVVRAAEPDLVLPTAVRHTGAGPDVLPVQAAGLPAACRAAATDLLAAVPGTIGVVAPADRLAEVEGWLPPHDDRIQVLAPLATKGMEYDGVLVVEPAGIAATAAGGARTLYVVLTRATQRLTVLTTDPTWPATAT